MKLKLFFFLVVVLFFSVVSKARAEDMRITCEGGGPCNIDFGSPLFNISSFAPGQSLTRQIVAINKDSTNSCNLTLYTRKVDYDDNANLFASKLATIIRSESQTFYENTFKNLLDYGGALSLGNIPTNNETKINWIVTFDPASENTLQSKKLIFDFDISFVCGSAPGAAAISTPTPTPTPTQFRGTLGLSTIVSPSPLPITGTPVPEVQGAECVKPVFPWWIPLVIEALILVSYILYLKRKGIKNKRWIILPIATAILSQAVHELLGCNCLANTNLCSKYLFINLALLVITYIFHRHPIASKAS